MLRTIFLFSTIYVTLFWSILLAGRDKKYSAPRIFLSRIMLFPLVINICHFVYFAPLPDISPYFDIPMYYSSLMIFPLYHIYFRLLTVDEKFSFKTHGKYLIVGFLIVTIYSIAVILTPKNEYKIWLYNNTAFPNSAQIYFLSILRILCRITYLIQVVITVIGNSILIKKYGNKAEQYYSQIEDGKNNNAKLLNYTIILMSIAAFIFVGLGRYLLMSTDTLICVGWSIFSILYFVIAYLGFKQKPLNPTFEVLTAKEEQNQTLDITPAAQKKILTKLKVEFEQKKVYLNSQLNIMDVVAAIGTNRTYISMIINKQYNQNFCSFVNRYRIEELKKAYIENPSLSIEALAEKGGFGSMNSMKRAIYNKTGLSLSEWKSQQLLCDE